MPKVGALGGPFMKCEASRSCFVCYTCAAPGQAGTLGANVRAVEVRKADIQMPVQALFL